MQFFLRLSVFPLSLSWHSPLRKIVDKNDISNDILNFEQAKLHENSLLPFVVVDSVKIEKEATFVSAVSFALNSCFVVDDAIEYAIDVDFLAIVSWRVPID